MILIGGLLRILIEQKTGMAIAAEVLGNRKEKKARKALIDLLHAKVILPVRQAAVSALGLLGEKEAIEPLLSCLKIPELAEDTALALLLLGEWKGLDEKAQLLVNPNIKSSRLLGEMVGRYGGPSYFLLLKQALDGDGAKSLGVCMGLGYLGDPRIVPELIHRSGSRNPKISAIASCALEIITGHFESSEEPLLRPRWQAWWDRNSGHFKPGYRYRLGKPMEIAQLIEHLKHDNRIVRQAAYDELVIATGVFLPFDIDGPWRVQQTHLFAWQNWWKKNEAQFSMGSWYFHGQKID
jgi:HEAT repeat protein